MKEYSARGFTAATAATADHALGALWNASSTKRICVVEYGIYKAGAGAANDSIYVCRITARGTAGSTVTPDGDNDWSGDGATPPSGALLDLAAYSVQPTRASPNLFGWVASAAAGAGFSKPSPRGIWIPAGTGLAICQRAATAWPTSEVYFEWLE